MQKRFQLRRSMLEGQDFEQLTTIEKLFLIHLMADMNAVIHSGGKFYRTDAYYAAALDVSDCKIRTVRKIPNGLGLIKFTPDRMTRNRPLATQYNYLALSKALPQSKACRPDPAVKRRLDSILTEVRASYQALSGGRPC